MLRSTARLLFTIARYLGVGLVGLLLGALAIGVLWLRGGPPLQPWHQVEFEEEFTAADASRVRTLGDYRALEARLFAELDEKVFAVTPTGPEQALVRFSPGSAADPRTRTPNWNDTFELIPPEPVGAVLLLHGMSDGPYSLRAIGEALFARGYRVLGLRLPGHGTAPAGLLSVTWEDLSAATRLGMAHLSQSAGGAPVHVIGYSTGAGLAVQAALDGLPAASGAAPAGPAVASLVLVSPAIGITPAARLTWWLEQASHLPGLERLGWTVVLPEFDPFNYTGFSANAALQVHRLTRSINARVRALVGTGPGAGAGAGAGWGGLAAFPPTLVLLSTVDRTVSADAVVDALLGHLPAGRHELVLYDINRLAITTPLLVADPAPFTNRLLADPTLPFTLTLVGNENPQSRTVVARTKPAGAGGVVSAETLAGAWPADAMSLSHVDLPFPPDDPLYGRCPPTMDRGLCFGGLAIRGEAGVIKVPAQWLMRLRYNPFYAWQERRVLDWIDGAGGGG